MPTRAPGSLSHSLEFRPGGLKTIRRPLKKTQPFPSPPCSPLWSPESSLKLHKRISQSSDPVALPLLRGASAQLNGFFMDTLLPNSALSVFIRDYESPCSHVGHYFRTSPKHRTIPGHFIRPTQHPSRRQIRKKNLLFNWQNSLEAKRLLSLS